MKLHMVLLLLVVVLLQATQVFAGDPPGRGLESYSCRPGLQYFSDVNSDGELEEIIPISTGGGSLILPVGTLVKTNGSCTGTDHWCGNTAQVDIDIAHKLTVSDSPDFSITEDVSQKIRLTSEEVGYYVSQGFIYDPTPNSLGDVLSPLDIPTSIYNTRYRSVYSKGRGVAGYFTGEEFENFANYVITQYVEYKQDEFPSIEHKFISTAQESIIISQDVIINETSGETETQRAVYDLKLERIFNHLNNDGKVETTLTTSLGNAEDGVYCTDGNSRLCCEQTQECFINQSGDFSVYGSFHGIKVSDTHMDYTYDENFGFYLVEPRLSMTDRIKQFMVSLFN